MTGPAWTGRFRSWRWNYSNTNHILAGMIAEKVSGRSLASLVEHRIARPLGLRRTYLVTATVKDDGPGYAHGYAVRFTGSAGTYTDVTGWPLGGWAGAAGAIVSTPSELATFSALLGGRLLPAAQLTQMRTLVPVSKEFAALGVEGYGLGLIKHRTACGTVWGHGGDTIGHHSTAVASADGHKVAVTDTTTQPAAPGPPIPRRSRRDAVPAGAHRPGGGPRADPRSRTGVRAGLKWRIRSDDVTVMPTRSSHQRIRHVGVPRPEVRPVRLPGPAPVPRRPPRSAGAAPGPFGGSRSRRGGQTPTGRGRGAT